MEAVVASLQWLALNGSEDFLLQVDGAGRFKIVDLAVGLNKISCGAATIGRTVFLYRSGVGLVNTHGENLAFFGDEGDDHPLIKVSWGKLTEVLPCFVGGSPFSSEEKVFIVACFQGAVMGDLLPLLESIDAETRNANFVITNQ